MSSERTGIEYLMELLSRDKIWFISNLKNTLKRNELLIVNNLMDLILMNYYKFKVTKNKIWVTLWVNFDLKLKLRFCNVWEWDRWNIILKIINYVNSSTFNVDNKPMIICFRLLNLLNLFSSDCGLNLIQRILIILLNEPNTTKEI